MNSEETYDFLSISKTDKVILSCAGLYPRSPRHSIFCRIRQVTVVSLIVLVAVPITVFGIQNISNTMKLTQALFISLSILVSEVKIINFIVNLDKLVLFKKYLSSDIFHDKAWMNIKRMKRDMEDINKVRMFYRFMILIGLVTLFLEPFFDKSEENRLPFESWIPWDISDFKNYVLTYLGQTSCTIIAVATTATIDILFATMCSIACTEIRVLKYNLENLDYSALDLLVKNELRRNIILYDEILNATEAIEKLFSYGILGQFFSSIIVICFTLLHLISPSTGEESDPLARYSYLTSCGTYLMCVMTEVSIYCIYGQAVLTESSDINQATYLSNWYVSNIPARKDLIMLRERAKKPIILTAGGLFPLTLETLVKIFKTSYSFLAVLRQRS
uniref:Odorant receptor n=1 Tax=Eucryptorrhynchus scrobiculatus TaxID=1552824 RepID=A0A8F4RQ54_EUCSC|nr:odorant receptor 30 [Eucryptorrhynchus scrobiculatus]